jgi:hypothetical protein
MRYFTNQLVKNLPKQLTQVCWWVQGRSRDLERGVLAAEY